MAFRKKSTRELVQAGGSADAGTATPPKKEKKDKPPRLPWKLRLKSRGFLGGCCVLAALLLAFVVTPLMAAERDATVGVVTLAADVPLGQRITPDLLIVKQMGLHGLPAGALTDPAAAEGRYLTIPLLEGDILTQRRLQEGYPTDTPELLNLGDRMALSVSLADLSQSVSGRLRAGDLIQLFAVLNNKGAATDASTPENYSAAVIPELQAVEVLLVTDRASGHVEGGQSEENLLATVVLSVDQRQAAALAGLNTNATLHAALLCRGDPEKKAALLLAQEERLASMDQSPAPAEEPAEETEEGETE